MNKNERDLLLFNVKRTEDAVKEFILKAPAFPDDGKLAAKCGEYFACPRSVQ